MFLRFVSGEIDEYSHVPAGLFNAALDLLWSDELPPYEFNALYEVKEWFNRHMASPFDCLEYNARYDPAICWFKSTARGHLARAWEMVEILERNDILIWTIKSPHVGYIHYEDDVQVFARPYGHMKRLLKRSPPRIHVNAEGVSVQLNRLKQR